MWKELSTLLLLVACQLAWTAPLEETTVAPIVIEEDITTTLAPEEISAEARSIEGDSEQEGKSGMADLPRIVSGYEPSGKPVDGYPVDPLYMGYYQLYPSASGQEYALMPGYQKAPSTSAAAALFNQFKNGLINRLKSPLVFIRNLAKKKQPHQSPYGLQPIAIPEEDQEIYQSLDPNQIAAASYNYQRYVRPDGAPVDWSALQAAASQSVPVYQPHQPMPNGYIK